MKTQKKTVKYLVITAIAFTLTVLFFAVFVWQAKCGLYAEKVNYLREISLKSAQNIKEQAIGYMATIESIATCIGAHDDFNLKHSMQILEKEAEQNYFKRMGVILPDGTAHTTDGAVSDFSDREYFKRALQGETVMSDTLVDKIDNELINVSAAPIYHNDNIVGVVFGTRRQDAFSLMMAIQSFDGKGYSYIIESDGTPVAKTVGKNSMDGFNNIFEKINSENVKDTKIKKLKSDIDDGINGLVEYNIDGESGQLCYTKIGINDWYLISLVPSYAISTKSDQLVFNLIILSIAITIVAMLVSVSIYKFYSKVNEKLKKIAYFDDVAGCANWAKFALDAKEILKNHESQKFAMISLDIKNFKVINDMFGHNRGNDVLKFIANVISTKLGSMEIFCRVGSDVFSILLKYENDNGIINKLEDISKEIESYIIGYKIEVAFGIYTIVSEHNLDINILGDRVSISKNIAKKKNDVNYYFFKDENRLEIIKEKEIENVMDKALVDKEFEVYLQPKYSLKTGEISSSEALVRWNRSGVGLISPNEFIPIFEKNGFIRKLDLYMFESVCQCLADWKTRFPNEIIKPISVNISRVHLSDQALPQKLLDIANKYNISTDLLEIELTESAVFLNVEKMISLMKEIKKMGFLVSIDDFGSGYSSLSALKDLPADYIKIDKSFLDAAILDKRGEDIISSIIAMARGLGILSVAEGAEEKEQIEMLKHAGCDIVQGYFFSRPVPIHAFELLMTDNKYKTGDMI